MKGSENIRNENLSLSQFVKILKKFAIDRSISDEDFTNALLLPIVQAGNVKDKRRQQLYLDKSRVSRLILQKDDIPNALRKALLLDNIEDKCQEGISDFLNDTIDQDYETTLADELCQYIESCDNISSGIKEAILSQRLCFESFILSILLETIKVNNRLVQKREENYIIWKMGENSVEVITDDLFRFAFTNRQKKSVVVIPANTAFDTCVSTALDTAEAPIVSENTIHGQFLLRWEKSGQSIIDLDTKIYENLSGRGIQPTHKSLSNNGKPDCYDVGTVAIVDNKNTAYFLLALSTFDKDNLAHATNENIVESIESIVDTYDKYGQGYPIYFPLFGTGRSRAGLSFKESYDIICNTLMKNKDKIHGKMYIVLYGKTVKDILNEEGEENAL